MLRRGKIFEAKADLRDDQGVVLAAATGKYLPIQERDLGGLLADLIGDWTTCFREPQD